MQGNLGNFSFPQLVPGSTQGNYGEIAIGPTGQVVLTYQTPTDSAGSSAIFTSVNPTGINGTFQNPTVAAFTNIGGLDLLPPQMHYRVDAEAGLAYDLSGGPHNGRLYMVYLESTTIKSGDTFVKVQFSDDNGTTWSAPQNVNDNTVLSAQMMPQDRGRPGHRARRRLVLQRANDPGFGPGDRDGHANDDVEMFVTVSTDSGATSRPTCTSAAGPRSLRSRASTTIATSATIRAWPSTTTSCSRPGPTTVLRWSPTPTRTTSTSRPRGSPS